MGSINVPTCSSPSPVQVDRMGGILLLLLPLVSASEEETHDRFLDGCSSHCTNKFDQNLSCWNKTAEFFGKTLMGVFLRYVTTQRSIDRMMKYTEYYHFDNNSGILRTGIISKTVIAFVSASFETLQTGKQPALLPCPKGCERPSNFWLSWSFISLSVSGILTAIIIIKTLEKDRMDRKHVLAEGTIKNNGRKMN
ncbi:hypothetical protein WUBG_01665 [Wuchereria bancrofti]|uniref:Uncharacterized protein n=1 Tax=Wuchereria bancrofti TaxID=6293 RepID=J9EYW8_WUCBA|nr:hypothetical protein WUBG_01665 [Wuchereria bancrofti]VDM11734.1 unnamed protein product [Wuchereria bancrofti]